MDPRAGIAVNDAARRIYDEMRKEKRREKDIIAEMERQGITDARQQFGALLRAERSAIKAAASINKAAVIEVQKDMRTELEIAREEMLKPGNAWDRQLAALNRVEQALLEREKGRVFAAQMVHGMSTPQNMYRVEMEGFSLHYAADSPEARRLAAVIIRDQALHGTPVELSHWTKNIYLSTLRNRADSHWEKAYNIRNFESSATGGDGNIVFYRKGLGETIGAKDSLHHEMGHNLARAIYGGKSDPGSDSAIGKLWDEWKAGVPGAARPPSSYAQVNRTEAFAEAVSHHEMRSSGMDQRYHVAVREAYAKSRALITGGRGG